MTLRDRIPAILALALPVLAGAAWMAAAGAPSHYWITNLGALGLAVAWIAVGHGPHTAASRHILSAALLLVLLAPLMVGPAVLSITSTPVVRWIPAGPLALHAGMLALPALGVMAARNTAVAAPLLLAATLAALIQPDAGTGFAITFAAVGLHHVTRDWKVGLTAIIAFIASLRMVVVGELPPQPFVERVLADAADLHLLVAIGLALAMATAFALVLFAVPASRPVRFTLAGAFFGFVVAAMMAPYPMPLIGYGAAPVLGFGLALGLHRKNPR